MHRAALLATLNRRVADVPGRLDYPYWVAHDLDVAKQMTQHNERTLDWNAV